MNWSLFGVALTDLVVILMLSLQPYIGSRTVLFGVFVPAEARDQEAVRALRRKFLIMAPAASVAAALAAGLARTAVFGGNMEAMVLFCLLLQFVLIGVLWIYCRQAALKLKEEQRWQAPASGKRVASLSFPRQAATIGNSWYLVHLLIAALCVIFAISVWDRIPQTLVTHYGLDGTPDGFSPKSVGSVFMPNFVQLGMIVLFGVMNTVIRLTRQSLDPQHPEQSMNRQVKFRRVSSFFLWGLSLIIVLFMGVIQGSMIYGWPANVVLRMAVVLPVLLFAAVLAFVSYLVRNNLDQQGDPTIQDDRYWRGGGMVYYNPNDTALFVPKRVGIGWTINFARPLGWIILLAIIAFIVLVASFAEGK
ncbi:Uncharacterized membrane protein [Paenibacillus sp. UNCCL117]|uniref:DUF1648 domain-containing protein n=1 Tax=unclassified Paenibacillus TaxID=185978 RepID=UPI00087EC88C|nr:MULTISPECIES: DUF5808 domain-containing protein [unclassified Paenibacillus]SDE27204.1 Uncharacterized membrane protein [Paenibacillus sp. cl123]SFW62783.1 Uncharacterized membrane protein [Paenibacillus sp. UNCCL117]